MMFFLWKRFELILGESIIVIYWFLLSGNMKNNYHAL